MRELLYNGGERAVLKQLTGAPRIIDDLPLSKRPDSAWMSKVIDHLNQIDLEQKVAEKYARKREFRCIELRSSRTERIFRVQRLEYGGNTYFGSTSTFMATVSSEITFLVPNGSDMLTLFFLPVTDDTILTSIASESQSSLSSSIVEINYVGNDGYRIINGSKSATDSITITFCDVESADVFLTMVEEQRTMNATGQAPANSNVQSERARKYSMAFVDLSVTNDESEHEAEVPSPFRSLPPQTFQKKSSPAAALSPNAHSVSKAANEKDMGKRHFTAEDDPSHSGGQHKSKSVQCQPTRRDGSKKSGEGTTRRESNSNSMAATNKLTDEDQLPGSDDSFDSQPEITNEPGVKVFSNPPKLVASENKRDLLDEENNTSEIIAGKTANKRKIPRGGSSRTMARHAEPRTEQKATMSIAAPVKVGLKRRSIIDSPVDEKSSHVDHTSDGDEYDLPSPEVEPARPTKKAKGSKQSTRKAATADSADDGEVEKQASTTKGHKIKRSNTKQRTSKVPNKTGEKTAASTRARRSTKAPIRIETSESDFSGKSDDNFQGSAGRKSNGSPSEEGKVDDDDDDAEVSPLKEQATETSIRGPTLDFEADSRNSFVTMEREKQIPPTKDALARTSSHQHFPSKRMAKAMIEGVIPRASNGLPRDPSIVHFEARGPTNQAILRDKSASETPEILAVEEGDEREKESDLEAVAKSLEDETTRLLQLPAEDDLAEPNTETSIADFDDRAEILVEQPTTISPESSDVSSPDQSCEESSEYVEADESCEAAEESAAPDELKCENLQKPYITPSGPRTPLLEDSEVGDVSLRMKEPPAPRHRRSIGLGTILAQDYPMAEKDINTGKMRSILRAGQLKDVKIGQDVTPAQDGITNPDTSASRGSNDSPSILAMATPTMPRERGFKVRSKYAMPPPPGENKADLAAGGRPMQAPSIPLRSMVNRQAAVSTVLPRKAPEQPSESTRSAPVRVKKTNQNLKDVSQAEIEMPPETPLFFCTRLNLRAPVLPESGLVVDQVKVSANKDTDQQAGNRSVTLVNDESFSGLRSTLWPRRRRRRSESSEGISLADSHSHGNEFDAETHPEAPRQVEVRDSQHGLLDAILSISNVRFSLHKRASTDGYRMCSFVLGSKRTQRK